MRVGLIGAGRIGANHARIVNQLPSVTELFIADLAEDRAVDLSSTLANTSPKSLDELLASSDALIIASSTDTHAELLIRAAKAGLPTFCEKPIALDLVSTRAAVSAIDTSGITVQMGFQRRYDPGIRAVRQAVESGEAGVIFLVRSQTHDPSPPPIDYIPSSGGIFKDCLIHDIDVVRYVTGQEVTEVTAFGTELGHLDIAAHGDYGTAAALLAMSGGTLAQISGMRLDPHGYDVRLEVFGSEQALAAGWSERTPISSTEPGTMPPRDPIRTFWDRFDAAYRAELEAFLRVAAGDELPASGPDDALQDLRVAEACSRSAAEKRAVALDEIE